MAAGEVASFVDLQLEELSPFPLEQLYYGRVTSGDAVFVYAAYRRRFSTEETQAWADKLFVLPEFAGILHLSFAESTTVFFRSAGALMAFRFEPGQKLPTVGAGRALAADADDSEVSELRTKLLSIVQGGDTRIVSLRPGKEPEQKPQGLRFVFSSDDGGHPVEVTVPSADCWPMDIREEEFVLKQRQRLRVDLIFWRVVVGAAAAIAVLLAGEVILMGAKGYIGWLESHVTSQADEAVALQDKSEIANRVAEFDRSDVQPIRMLLAVAGRKPQGVIFERATISAGNALEFDARTPNVAEVNQYEASIREMAEVTTVVIEDIRTSAEGTDFSMLVNFQPGAFPAGGTKTAAAR